MQSLHIMRMAPLSTGFLLQPLAWKMPNQGDVYANNRTPSKKIWKEMSWEKGSSKKVEETWRRHGVGASPHPSSAT